MATAPHARYITPASPVVVEQINRLNDKADRLDNLARGGVHGLLGFQLDNVDLDPRTYITDEAMEALLRQLGDLPEFDPNTDWLAGLNLGVGNEDFRFNPELVQYLRQMLPEFNIDALPDLGPAPTPPPDVPFGEYIAPPTRPDTPTVQRPDIDVDVEIPEYRDFTADIPFPTLRPITLPNVPTINVDDIVFDGERPVFDITPPDAADFAFDPTEYQPLLLSETKAKVLEIFNGGTGLPPAVETALFERAREREVEVGERAAAQARDEWGARGFKAPPGQLFAAEHRARREANSRLSDLNREQFVEHHRARLEMLREALSTAMAAEDLWGRLFMSAEDRRLQAARIKVDLSVQVFSAMISRYQAMASMYAIDAQVFNQKFQAAMAKLQLYSEELRAKQIVGELNEQDVRIFAQRIGALQANAEIYRARIEGVKAIYDTLDTKVGLFRAELESNNTLIAGYEADVRAFAARLQGQATDAERYRTMATVYATNVQARRDTLQSLIAQQDQSFKKAELTRDVFSTNTERVRAYIQGEEGRIGALTDKYRAMAAEIASKSEVERSRYQLMLSIAQAHMARYEAAADMLMKNGEISIQSALQAENMMLRAQETATTTLAQMAAGYTSAANVSASIDDRSSASLNYNFSGELDLR